MKFTEAEWREWVLKYANRNPLVIASNTTGYSYDNTSFSTNAVLYWSQEEDSIRGIVYKEKQRGGSMGGDRWYEVQVLYHALSIPSLAELKRFNKSKGKSVDSSSAGWAWKKRWFTPHHSDESMGFYMPLQKIWESAHIRPYDFLAIDSPQIMWGIVNQRQL